MNTLGMDAQGFYNAERLWHRVPMAARLKKLSPDALITQLALEGFIEALNGRWRPLAPYHTPALRARLAVL